MSGGPRVRSMNLTDSEQRPVLVPAGNKERTVDCCKPAANKPQRKVERSPESDVSKDKKQVQLSPKYTPPMRNLSAPSILRNQQANQLLLRGNLSLNASCSSDASSDSSHSRASTGRISRNSVPIRRKQGATKLDRVDSNNYNKVDKVEKVVWDEGMLAEPDGFLLKKRCAWVTTNAEDPSYATFHDEEWGVPVHDDNKLFELLSLSVALAELTWPTILRKRNIFREVFLDFNPVSVSKLNEKKISAPGSTLLSEIKLRNIVENARQVCKITEEFGSFDKYIWGFMNHKPIVNKFRYQRQVPVKTSKAEVISKDLVRRGFRGVGPTVAYSFMQAAGLTNDHLVSCFRYQDCISGDGEGIEKEDNLKSRVEEEKPEDMIKVELVRAFEEMSTCSDG